MYMKQKVVAQATTFLIRTRTNPQIRRFLVYGVLSGLALGFELVSIYVLTKHLAFHYLTAASLAFTVAVIGVYVASRKLVFKNQTGRSALIDFGLFAATGLVGLVLNDVIIWFMVEQLNAYVVYAKLSAAVFVFCWNFLARLYLFSPKTPELALEYAETQ